jgi:TolB-like protein/Tfp pilus assembly protein PilF
MSIWSSEIKELEKLYGSFKGQLPELEKELERLIRADDENMILLYSRRCLEVIITDLCECELKRPRKTEPLKGIIDKLHKEEKVPSHIITSMHGLNELSTYGAHPKDFDPEQLKPVLNNLNIIIKWYLRYKDFQIAGKPKSEKEKHESKKQIASTREKSIAVLPFVDMSPERDQEYFCEGISEEIINVLAQLPNLKVTGRTSSFTFKGKNEDLRSIGEKLGVRNILEGSVRSSGSRIRITTQLIDVQSGFHLWSEKYDRIINDVFEVQDEIARAIMEKLKITMAGKTVEPKHRQQTQNVEAYQHYLKGRALVYKRGEYLFEAMTYFQMALEIDPQYALAYAGLADVYTIICYYGLIEPTKTWPKAIESARLAFKFGPDLAESYNCSAAISLLHDWNWELARMQFLKALELNSGYEQARIWYGLFFLQMAFGNHEEAILNIRFSLNANPLSFYSYTILGLSLGIAGQNKEGLEKAKRAFEMEPTSYMTQYFLADLYDWSGKFGESINMYDMALLHSNRHSWALSCLAITYAHWARKDKAEELYQELIEQSKLKYIQPATLAIAAAAIGKDEEALRFAHKACDEHDPFLIFTCRVHPYGKELRSIRGFDEILKRMGLL